MSIQSASVPIGATFSPTGGSATSLLTKRQEGNTVSTILDDGSAFIDQTVLEFSTKEPKVSASAPDGYTQRRNVVYVKVPRTLANGNTTVDTLRLEVAASVETSAANLTSLRELAVHALTDSDFTDFWEEQSMS